MDGSRNQSEGSDESELKVHSVGGDGGGNVNGKQKLKRLRVPRDEQWSYIDARSGRGAGILGFCLGRRGFGHVLRGTCTTLYIAKSITNRFDTAAL